MRATPGRMVPLQTGRRLRWASLRAIANRSTGFQEMQVPRTDERAAGARRDPERVVLVSFEYDKALRSHSGGVANRDDCSISDDSERLILLDHLF